MKEHKLDFRSWYEATADFMRNNTERGQKIILKVIYQNDRSIKPDIFLYNDKDELVFKISDFIEDETVSDQQDLIYMNPYRDWKDFVNSPNGLGRQVQDMFSKNGRIFDFQEVLN